jgi:hypothetical protein
MKKTEPMTDLIEDFKKSLKRLRPSTRRVYLAGAKAAIHSVKADLPECHSYSELLSLIVEAKQEKRTRVAPFVRFLRRGGEGTNDSRPVEDVSNIQFWVIQSLATRVRTEKNPPISSRRDMALLASLCVAPTKGNPRNWLRNSLKMDGDNVILWDKRVDEPAFAVALRFWYSWRERLARPDQRRLFRKASEWSNSKLLFPGPHGEALSRVALHNALRRLLGGIGAGDFTHSVTPKRIRFAFLARDTFGCDGF